MKNSPFKITVFVISVITLLLLVLLCWYIGVFSYILSKLQTVSLIERIGAFFLKLINNEYFINISCTILTAFALYRLQIIYSKRHIIKDFRCNEVLSETDYGIEKAIYLYNSLMSIEGLQSKLDEPDYLKRTAYNAEIYIKFYNEHTTDIELAKDVLTYYNNQILLDSLQSVFFININFKLLNILNNIKNRIPNVKDNYQELDDSVKHYQDKPSDLEDQELGNLGNKIYHYISDMNFLAKYYLDLYSYLNFDMNDEKELNKYIVSNYSGSFFSLSQNEQLIIIKKAQKIIRKQKTKRAWNMFFKNTH